MNWLPPLIAALTIGLVVYRLVIQRNGERARNAPLRSEIEAQVCFETVLYRASKLGTGGLGGTRGLWIPVKGSKRLIVGTDAFMVSAPQALREFVFRGRESSIAFSQAPSLVVTRDWIVITGQANGRQVQLAITQDNLPDIWQALEATGAAPVLRVINSSLPTMEDTMATMPSDPAAGCRWWSSTGRSRWSDLPEGRSSCWFWRSDADGNATWGPTSRPVPQWTRPGATPVQTLGRPGHDH